MKAFIFAAGEGRRMRPLTLDLPKPLLEVDGAALIEHQLKRLKAAGINEFVINTAYLGEQIERFLGDGERYGVSIVYSREGQPLETGGAIERALPLLGDEPFLIANSDVWTDFDFSSLVPPASIEGAAIHLVLVENPEHHRAGDFSCEQGRVGLAVEGSPSYTYSGMAVVSPTFFSRFPRRRDVFRLKELLDWGIEQGEVSGEIYLGQWMDIGTPERLEALRRQFL